MKRCVTIWKTVLTLVLALCMVFSLAACATVDAPQVTDPAESLPTTPTEPTAPTDPIPTVTDRPELGAKVDPDTPFVPVARYVITSDVHIRTTENNYKSHDRLAELYQTAYAYSDAQEDYANLDGIFFLGDITNNGKIDEYTYFFDYVNANTREGTVARATLGNHECFDTGNTTDKSMKNKAPQRFLEQSGYEELDTTLTIGGNRFIFVAIDQYKEASKSFYSEEKLEWLKKELDAAVAEDFRKPIFVMGHVHASNTVVGSYGKSADAALRELLDNYPQVIFFSGHTHNPLSNMSSIWQETFTAVNTGSLAFISQAIPDHDERKDGGAQAFDTLGTWEMKIRVGDRNGVLYWLVETDQYDRIRLQIYNMETQSLWGETYLIDSLNPTDYVYTNSRKNASDKPVFPADASIAVQGLTHKTIAVAFPQAQSKDVVQSYRVELYKNGILEKTEHRLACTYYGDAAPKTLMANFGSLEPATAYTIKVYAVNSWEKESDPLTIDFTTKAAGDDIEADVLDVSFAEDGSAFNAITGRFLNTFGDPAVSYEEGLGKYIASFDGVDDGYTFEEIAAWYGAMAQGFSIEIYTYLEDAGATASYLVGNVDTGGFGLSYRGGSLYFTLFSGVSSSSTPGVALTDEQWVHVVATFDGSQMCLYVDGQLAAQKTVNGNLKASEITSRFLAIGADSGTDNQMIESLFKGKIADLKIYSAELSEQQIEQIYQNYAN